MHRLMLCLTVVSLVGASSGCASARGSKAVAPLPRDFMDGLQYAMASVPLYDQASDCVVLTLGGMRRLDDGRCVVDLIAVGPIREASLVVTFASACIADESMKSIEIRSAIDGRTVVLPPIERGPPTDLDLINSVVCYSPTPRQMHWELADGRSVFLQPQIIALEDIEPREPINLKLSPYLAEKVLQSCRRVQGWREVPVIVDTQIHCTPTPMLVLLGPQSSAAVPPVE